MNKQEYLALLRRFDDANHFESPVGFQRQVVEERESKFTAFAEQMQIALGEELMSETGVYIQDASFHGQIAVPKSCLLSDSVSWILVSNFGNFATTDDVDGKIKPACLEKIKFVIRKCGYVYIPTYILQELYDGDHPVRDGITTWAYRYFDFE